MTNKWHKETIALSHPSEKIPLPILHDGAIAIRGLGDGRLIPLVIVDAASRLDVRYMVRIPLKERIDSGGKSARIPLECAQQFRSKTRTDSHWRETVV